MKISVLDASTLGEDLSLSPLESLGEVKAYPTLTGDALIEALKESDVVIVNKIKLNESNLGGAKSLKLICVAATGYDNIDLDYCEKNGIAVCNVVGYSTHSVAQVTLAMVFSLATNIPQFTDFVRSGEYTKSGVANRLTPVYHELCGKTWGILGYGNIGKQVGRVAEAMGCKVIACSRTQKEGVTCVGIDELFEKSDIISVHTPLTEQTHGIVNEERIAKMKKSAILINVARGAVTDEAALAKAIKDGKIAGLGIDVYDGEPMSEDNPLYEIREYENVCLTPHMAWGAVEARRRCLDEMIENIKAYFAGERRNRIV